LTSVNKPPMLYDRAVEWRELSEFVVAPQQGATLGLVYGRRRQGKTLMLELLAEAHGGFMFTGLQQSNTQNLHDLADAYARFAGVPGATFVGWREAIDALLRIGERRDRPIPVVLDEFPFLLESERSLTSILQTALSPRGRARRNSTARLILCGSALTTMRGLLGGSAPLRGRSALELMVHPFGFRAAAGFWGLERDPDLAFRVHALVGGTPAYREMCVDAPDGSRDFDAWVVRRLLNPASAMFREGNILLHEQPEVGDPTLYYSVLAAISRGAHRRGEIATALGRKDSALTYPLVMLEHTLLIERLEDALRERRPVYRIAEPAIRFQQLVIRPAEARLVRHAAEQVWADSADTVNSLIYGPHLEDLARDWCLSHADPATIGGRPSRAQPAVLACRSCRVSHELDVVAVETSPSGADRIIAIGEVKSTNKQVDVNAVRRLEHIRDLLPANRVKEPPALLLFSRSGFTKELHSFAGNRSDIQPIDLPRLYAGD
jgi:AAA+ ATPase superfamily predicted ATPase